MTDALRKYEEEHPELCELIDDENSFYGFTKSAYLMDKHIQWVYVPAVKDASSEQQEGSKTALGQILECTVRAKVNFKTSIAELKRELEGRYKEIVDAERSTLHELQGSIQKRLQDWTNPGIRLSLDWHYDYEKSLVINQPLARVEIGEDDFMGAVARLGHGLQRSFLVSMLQELAGYDADAGPTLLLGFEEPELYQHPPQAQHFASLLERITSGKNTQIIVTTHSPYFVTTKGFEGVRMGAQGS